MLNTKQAIRTREVMKRLRTVTTKEIDKVRLAYLMLLSEGKIRRNGASGVAKYLKMEVGRVCHIFDYYVRGELHCSSKQ